MLEVGPDCNITGHADRDAAGGKTLKVGPSMLVPEPSEMDTFIVEGASKGRVRFAE